MAIEPAALWAFSASGAETRLRVTHRFLAKQRPFRKMTGALCSFDVTISNRSVSFRPAGRPAWANGVVGLSQIFAQFRLLLVFHFLYRCPGLARVGSGTLGSCVGRRGPGRGRCRGPGLAADRGDGSDRQDEGGGKTSHGCALRVKKAWRALPDDKARHAQERIEFFSLTASPDARSRATSTGQS
jgi:hypothetical protein